MSSGEFLDSLLADRRQLIEREVKFAGGKVGKIFFRHITAGERYQLVKGQKLNRTGGSTSFELDLALNEEQQQRLVQYAVVKADGSPYFKDLAAVKLADAAVVKTLAEVAASLDAEEEEAEPGKP